MKHEKSKTKILGLQPQRKGPMYVKSSGTNGSQDRV